VFTVVGGGMPPTVLLRAGDEAGDRGGPEGRRTRGKLPGPVCTGSAGVADETEVLDGWPTKYH